MKNTKWFRCLAAMALAITMYAGKSEAGRANLPAGGFRLNIHQGGYCNNPNEFPVVLVFSNTQFDPVGGFLLDGSESATSWLKIFQDAISNQRGVSFLFDDVLSRGFCGYSEEFGQGVTATGNRIATVLILP